MKPTITRSFVQYCIIATLLVGVLVFPLVTAQSKGTGATMSVTSKDGTRIAYSKSGQGEPLILVSGALVTRADLQPFADLLGTSFTVYNYDRRGRGESGDTQPYAVRREIDDIETMIDLVGGTATLVGFSSGGMLALESASAHPEKVKKLALYEVPMILDGSRPPVPADYVAQLDAAIAAGDRGKAVELFAVHALNMPNEYLEPMRRDPSWKGLEALAHTLAYDGRVMGNTMSGKPLEAAVMQRWRAAAMPTLVMSGAASEGFFRATAQTLTSVLPNAKHQELEGQDHNVAPAALAPILVAFIK
jgi:pimeloyl-ACP methyl ester carboxylesterase